jgi:hypothetical protein
VVAREAIGGGRTTPRHLFILPAPGARAQGFAVE